VNPTRTYHTLTYAGGLPFIACALLPWAGITSLGPLGPVSGVLLLYGLSIVSFLCGTQWAAELQRPGESGLPLLLISNLIVVVTWLAVLAAAVPAALLLQALALLALLLVDARLYRRGALPAPYWRLRQRITAIAVAALALAAAAAL